MKRIPENKEDIQKLLYEQTALLVEGECNPYEIRENIKLLLEIRDRLF